MRITVKISAWMMVGLIGLVGLAAFVGSAARAQDRFDSRKVKSLADSNKKKRKVLIESGHRHLKLGIWCRDQGLVSQASMEFIRAVEVSEHRHPGAQKVLSIMRSLGDDFWKKRRRKTHTRLLEQYEKRTAKATQQAEKARFGLAKWAYGKGLDEGKQEFLRLLELNDAPLTLDKKGQVVLPAGALPLDLSQEIEGAAVTINDRLWVRDRFLSKIPNVSAIHEVESDRIRVRSQVSVEQAQAVLDICTALLPFITDDTGGRPQQRMNVFVFADRKTYEGYLEALDMLSHKRAAGLAFSGANMALVNGDGRSEDETLGIALHEVAHLFMYGVTRSMMPSWYSEGFAETYGGQGCYEWKDGTLVTHGVMAANRVNRLKTDAGFIPLRTFFAGNALALINSDLKKASNFYTQSWAFVRFMREGAGDAIRNRFGIWEDTCRGKALGAVFDQPTENGDAKPSQQLFEEMFGAEIDELEVAFREYLGTL